jgi:sulfopyruvate decarboxylase TPP-binding subunit
MLDSIWGAHQHRAVAQEIPMPDAVAEPSWPDDLFETLRAEQVTQVAYVPDAGHAGLIARCHADEALNCVRLTTEEEGVAMLCGSWLGGERGVLLMQSSGVGNCINMLAMARECRFPLLMLITMRGEWGEFNPWQVPMGQGTQPVLEAAGVIVQRANVAGAIRGTALAAARLAFNTGRPVAVLIGQQVLGFKDWK